MLARSRILLSLERLCRLERQQGWVTGWDEYQKTTIRSANCL